MYENAVGPVGQEDPECEALSVIKEAERLQKITLVYFNIDAGDSEKEPPSPDQSTEDEVNQDEDHAEEKTFNIGLCVARVQRAARSVVEEARRLQFETERYEALLLGGADSGTGGTASAPEEGAGAGNYHDVVQEALAVARETERLQKLVVHLLAGIIEPAVGGESEDD